MDSFKVDMEKVTEQDSLYRHLEKKSSLELLGIINDEDSKVALAVKKVIPNIASLVDEVIPKMNEGGRLFYLGAGTSGRLGVLDASECPPTFGVPHDWVVGLIAGGDGAIRKAIEFAEDDDQQAWLDLQAYGIDELDTIVGIAASGTTPYVIGGLRDCRDKGITTACITCNPDSPLSAVADHVIEVIVGPEFVTGSTRMKSGTAQKMVLNMISTTVMIGLGRVEDNKMVDMQLSNNKLVDRGTKLVMKSTGLDQLQARDLLLSKGSVRKALDYWATNLD
jgi:N-acetylmuramic acid 6-phosphate etherase